MCVKRWDILTDVDGSLRAGVFVTASDYDALEAELALSKSHMIAPSTLEGLFDRIHVAETRIRDLEVALEGIARIAPLGVDTYPECYRRIQKIAGAALGITAERACDHDWGWADGNGAQQCRKCSASTSDRETIK
jgi:hypothetical protein